MQTRGFRAALSALFSLALSFDTLHAASASFPPQGDDVTPSLGQMKILIAPNFQAMMTGNPNYNSSTHIFTSPLLYDPVTVIGRSSVLLDGSAGDGTGVPTGSAGTVISQSNLIVQPGGLEPAGTREVHTEIRSLNLVDFGGSVATVRAGTNAVGRPISAGEVESLSGAGGSPSLDFPAQSFFDVFVQVDIPTTGTFPGATNLYNDLPLLVQLPVQAVLSRQDRLTLSHWRLNGTGYQTMSRQLQLCCQKSKNCGRTSPFNTSKPKRKSAISLEDFRKIRRPGNPWSVCSQMWFRSHSLLVPSKLFLSWSWSGILFWMV